MNNKVERVELFCTRINEVMIPTILIDNITYTYDGALRPVFDKVTMSIDTSWRLGIIGRNGRGKTTLLGILAGNLKPQSGVCKLPEHVSMFPIKVVDGKAGVSEVVKRLIGPVLEIENELNTLLGETSEKHIKRYGELLELFEHYRGYELDA